MIFNRPEQTRQVFREIARYKPARLLVVADGPRTTEEERRCLETRSVIDQVDWHCEVLTNYSDINLGCKRRILSGLDWVFEQCEAAIILEDDCLPHPSFFLYCAELLERYRYDTRVMMISGNNFVEKHKNLSYSYYYSLYPLIWGWASWRRAWKYYDTGMALWPNLRESSWLSDILGQHDATIYWRNSFDSAYHGEVDTWDYTWTYSCWTQSGSAICPAVNLVSNIGFGEHASHTGDTSHVLANVPSSELIFPISHPPVMIRERTIDEATFRRAFMSPTTSLEDRVYRALAPHLPQKLLKGMSLARRRLLH